MRKSLVTTGLAAANLATIAGLAGCGGSAPTGQAAPNSAPASQAPASDPPGNPVPILKQTGATPDPGTSFGQYDIYGGRYVSGAFPGGETVNVTADPGLAAYQADLARNGSGDDGHGVVVIPSKSAVIFLTPSAAAHSSGFNWEATAQQVAARVGSQALTPGMPAATP